MELIVFDFLKDLLDLPESVTKTIVVAKPICTPARDEIIQIFKHYGVKVHDLKQIIEMIEFEGKTIPGLYKASVTVTSKQAEWAEYLLLRSHKFMLWSKPLNKRNLEWASRHKLMPPSWNGKPLIERNCKEGLEALKKSKRGVYGFK